ncbi:MAG TPA: peptidylprolyl isomerase [Ignavibacteriaceae bacterium]|jgi:peptidyl-prolyl cis-trans isomerase SurA|nr:MAG: Chaperone SurA precursor [Ignavibacteria bacterium ADurb.Bin266]OQY74648.1 MAG: parvulin peptidyl-prolyl isomerase [Ignavibacteriales bacterium UTCHB2]HQF41717.1 peptidylprolyl isomerase [Ignavibacteriaceae bacterium]HQI41352.1 peptidylprolyl isomerase [Ignavibacteriaceae bacterium]
MKIKLLAILTLFTLNIFAQEVLDKIVAVVDNEIILKSELDFQVSVFASQRQLDPNKPGLREQILNSMIEEKLIYAQADLDSITVSEDEINQRIDYQINIFTQQYGSVANIEKIYGMSIDRIKRELRDEVRKSLMSQRLQEKNFGKVQATRREVEEFFNTYKDSIGLIPEKVTIYHIFQNPKASAKLKKKFYDKALALLDSIKAGKDFSELARKYSDDPGSAAQGGDLGFVKKGVFYPEFEEAAFKLNVGEISGVVESPVGFHIIQMLEKRGESVNTRHILIKIKADEDADLKTIDFLSEIRDSIQKGFGTFQEYAKKYSEDKETAPFGGELGTFYMNQLDKALLDAVGKLKQGEIGYPRRLEYAPGTYGYHIVWLKSRVPQHKADLESDYSEIKKLADDFKKQNEYSKWIAEIKKKIFWEIRI